MEMIGHNLWVFYWLVLANLSLLFGAHPPHPLHLCSCAVLRSCEFPGEETALLFQVCTLPNTAGPQFTAPRCCTCKCKQQQQQTPPISAPAHMNLDWARSWHACLNLILQESSGQESHLMCRDEISLLPAHFPTAADPSCSSPVEDQMCPWSDASWQLLCLCKIRAVKKSQVKTTVILWDQLEIGQLDMSKHIKRDGLKPPINLK